MVSSTANGSPTEPSAAESPNWEADGEAFVTALEKVRAFISEVHRAEDEAVEGPTEDARRGAEGLERLIFQEAGSLARRRIMRHALKPQKKVPLPDAREASPEGDMQQVDPLVVELLSIAAGCHESAEPKVVGHEAPRAKNLTAFS